MKLDQIPLYHQSGKQQISRRFFLKLGAAGIASLTVGPLVSACTGLTTTEVQPTIVSAQMQPTVTALALAHDSKSTWAITFDPTKDSGSAWTFPSYTIMAIEPFNGNMYVAVGDLNDADGTVQVFRSVDGKHWEVVSEPGLGTGYQTIADKEIPLSTSMDMIVFKDKLYISLMSFSNANKLPLRPGVILSTSDGTTWTKVVDSDELGLGAEYNHSTIYGQFHKFAVFQNMLYVSADWSDPVTNWTAGAVYRSATGTPGSWEKVGSFPNWNWAGSFQEFKGALYIASDGVLAPDNSVQPEEVWRSKDGKNWQKVVSDGFGAKSFESMGGFAVFQDYLYAGSSQVWRSKDGTQWEKVDGLTPLLGPNDLKVDGLTDFEGKLYAWTYNQVKGGSMFSTREGQTWERVNQPGWTETGAAPGAFKTTHLTSAQTNFNGDLYIGIFGDHGPLLKMVQH
jgi:hypothetical protein